MIASRWCTSVARPSSLIHVPDPSGAPAAWHRAPKESPWRRDDGILLDLHSRLGDHPALIPGAVATVKPQIVEVPGGIALPTLPDRLLLPYLAVHGASSAWFRIKWLADFAALVARTSPDALADLADQAPRLGAGRTFAAALILANRLLGTSLPETLEADRASLRLVAIATAMISNIGEPTKRPFGTLPIHRSQMLMVPGSHYFLSEIMRKVGQLLIR